MRKPFRKSGKQYIKTLWLIKTDKSKKYIILNELYINYVSRKMHEVNRG